MQVLDYSGGYPGAFNIAHAGFGGAVRYIGYPDRRKCTNSAELRDFTANGIGMALVFENNASAWRRGWVGGQADARTAREHATAIGFPEHRPIYMAVDQQVTTAAELGTAAAYVDGAASVLGIEQTGVYGQYSVMEACRDLCDYFWQCRAWSGTPVKYANHRDLFQRVGTVRVGGIDCDVNDVIAVDWGQHNFIYHTEETELFNYKEDQVTTWETDAQGNRVKITAEQCWTGALGHAADANRKVDLLLAKLDSFQGTIDDNQAALLAAIGDEPTQVSLTDVQIQKLLDGIDFRSKQAIRDVLGSLDNEVAQSDTTEGSSNEANG
jgi:Domain of unknown function (DUF1906)